MKSTSCNAVYKYIYTPVVLQKIKRYVNPSEGVTSTDEKDANLTELSMGMSSDYEIGIQNGATFIRIGSNIFGSRN